MIEQKDDRSAKNFDQHGIDVVNICLAGKLSFGKRNQILEGCIHGIRHIFVWGAHTEVIFDFLSMARYCEHDISGWKSGGRFSFITFSSRGFSSIYM